MLYNQILTAGNTWNTLLLPALRSVGNHSEGRADRSSGCGLRVILADNSTDPEIREENRITAEKQDVLYLDMQGNQGLPKAYNRAIEAVLQTGEESIKERSWIVTADQDTFFPEQYLQVLAEAAARTDCDVLAPVVKAGEKQLSPCCRKGSRFVPLAPDSSGERAWQNAFFINAGLVFRSALFADPEIRYDEQLFLDFTDFDLISRIRARAKSEVRFGRLRDVVLQQNFSGTETRAAEEDLERFRHFAHDGRLFYERWYGKGAAEAAIRARALKLAVRHRDGRFLKSVNPRQ